MTDRIGAERRTHRTLFKVTNTRRQRARTQDHGQVFGLLLGEGSGDASFVVNLLLNGRNFLNFIVENHGQLIVDVCAGKGCEAASTFTSQEETDGWTLILIPRGLGVAQDRGR